MTPLAYYVVPKLGSPRNEVDDTPISQESEWTSRPPPAISRSPPLAAPSKLKRKRSKDILPYNKKRDPHYIPRPPNSFMLFRRDFVANRPEGYTAPGSKSLSKQTGEAWRLLPSSERKKWAKKAHDASAEHARRNPGWKYRPSRKSDKSREEHQSSPPPPPPPPLPPQQQPFIFHENPVSPAFFHGSTPSSSLIRRKESLQLYNWDDSVLPPAPQTTFPEEMQIYHIHESLRRRSSSVPIPETWNSTFGALVRSQAPAPPTHPPSSSYTQHRLSYSGIRPGFMPLDIYSHQPQRDLFEDTPLQPLPAQRDDPPPSFEGYRIVCGPTTGDPASTIDSIISPGPQSSNNLYASPLNVGTGTNGKNIAPIVDNVDGISPRTIPLDLPSHIHVFGNDGASAPVHGQSLHHPDHPGPDYLVERIRSIDFGTSQVSNSYPTHATGGHIAATEPSTEFFPLDMPLSDFFPQYMHHFDPSGTQLSGLGGFDAAMDTIITSQQKGRERGLHPRFNCDFPAEFDMFPEFVETPRSEPFTYGSSPGSLQHRYVESRFGQ